MDFFEVKEVFFFFVDLDMINLWDFMVENDDFKSFFFIDNFW